MRTSGRDLLLTLLCSTAALKGVVRAGDDAAPAQSGVSEIGEPHAAEWRAAVQRLEEAYKKAGGGPLPDDDPQMREDFLTLSKLDPPETLEFLNLHPLKSRVIISGSVHHTLKFYVPGIQEIGRSSPDLLADWLAHFDRNSPQDCNVFGDGAAALSGNPDAFGKLFLKRGYHPGTLIDWIVRGAVAHEGFSLSDFAQRLGSSKRLPSTYRDQILIKLAVVRGSSMTPAEVGSLLAAAHSSASLVKILSEVLSHTAADQEGITAMLNLVSPNLALAAITSRTTRCSYPGDPDNCVYVRAPDAILDIMVRTKATKALESSTRDVFSTLKNRFPDKVGAALERYPDSEWKTVMNHQALAYEGRGNWNGKNLAERSMTDERRDQLKGRFVQIYNQGLTASLLESLRPEEWSLFFAKGLENPLQTGGDFRDWDAAANSYIANASLVSPENRVMAAKDFAPLLAAEDPETAVDWFSHLTGEAEREEAARGIVTGWAELDIQAAAKWLATVTDPKAKKAGAQIMVDQLVGGDTPMRQEWQRIAEGG